MNYLSYWSLRNKPFADPTGFFYAGTKQREALAGLSHVVTHELGTAFLVAEPRCGTTRLLQYVAGMHGFGNCAVEVVVTEGADDGNALLSAAAIEASERKGIRTIWMIDGCEPDLITAARTLIDSQPGLSIVLATTPANYAASVIRLGRMATPIELERISFAETVEYLERGLECAGRSESPFTEHAAERMHELADGAIADVAALAELSLAIAANDRMDQVDAKVISNAARAITSGPSWLGKRVA